MLKPPAFKGVLPMNIPDFWTAEAPLERSAYLVHRCLHASVNWSFAEWGECGDDIMQKASAPHSASGTAICAWLARGRQTQHWWCFSPFQKSDKGSLIMKEVTRSHLGYSSQRDSSQKGNKCICWWIILREETNQRIPGRLFSRN